jgi:autotransporter-associated beta strand protein
MKNPISRLSFLLAAGLALSPAARAANLTWDAGNTANGATIDPASGTWDTTSTFWNNAGANVAWTAANVAQFGGSDGTYAINIGTALSAQRLVFLNSGYMLSASAPVLVSSGTAGSGAAPNVQVDAGKTATLGTNVTVRVTATTAVFGGVVGNAGSRTLVIDNGGTLEHTGSSSFIVVGNATIRIKPGGTLNAANTGTQVTIGGGTAGADSPVVSVEGGTFTHASTGSPLNVGNNNSGTLTITNNGTVAMNANVSQPLQLGSVTSGGKTGTLNLDGGTLTVNRVSKVAGNTAIFNFNGGKLRPNNPTNAANFMTGLDTANVRNGGAVLDNNGFAVTIAQPLLHSAIGGDNATDGGLVSSGAGTHFLTGANTYNGPTTVNSGTLAITTASTGAGSYAVADAATLEVQVAGAGQSLAASGVTLGTTGNLALKFSLGGFASPVTPAFASAGALTLNGAVTINVTGSGFTGPNSYALMSYGSISGSGGFVAGSLPTVAGYLASITNNTSANQLLLVYTPAPEPVKWAVGNGDWNTTDVNWNLVSGGGPASYLEGAPVVFDDSASGTSPITVTVASARTPAAVTNDATKDYYFVGNGGITSSSLVKAGSGTLVLDNVGANSFAAVTINAGTLQLGNDDANGSLGAVVINNAGSLRFKRSDNVVFNNLISGTGGVVKSGVGNLTLSGSNTYSGATLVNSGKLTLSTANQGAGSLNVADGAAVEVQVHAAGASLTNSALTLGTAGGLNGIFTLGALPSTTSPVMRVNGTLALDGTVAVSVTGSGFTTGTYPLIAYNALSGAGSFVLASAPLIAGNAVTLTNDTAANQLKLFYTAVSAMSWDSGDIGNGATIDAASGAWDLTQSNLAWNDNGVNRPWINGVDATFAGADGTWAISLTTNVSPKTLTFANDGYALSAVTPQTVTMTTSGSGAAPNLKVAEGKATVIGTNLTVQTTGANNLIVGGPAGTGNPAGAVVIENGGKLQLAGNSTLGLVGGGASITVKSGGVLSRTIGGNFLLGSIVGDNCVLNVDGGTVAFSGTGIVRVGGNSTAGNVAGTLNLNAGSFSMDAANTTQPMSIGATAGNFGTNNLNGGTLSVNQIVKGNAGATAIFNFNGGYLRAVNGAQGANFLTGLTRANVRNGGAFIDNNAFNLTIGQALEHSDLAGDNAVDGGLTSTGSGTLTLLGVNTYTGDTTISNGNLALGASASITASPTITVVAGATIDVTAAAPWSLGVGQTLRGNGTVNGGVAAAGTIAPGLSIGTLTFNSAPALTGSIILELNRTNAQSADKIVFSAGATFGGELIVTNVGAALVSGDTFDLFDGALSGSFASMNLPNGAAHWDTTELVGAGTITFTNATPAASDVTVAMALGQSAAVVVIGGTNTPIDTEGDALTITGVSAASGGAASFDVAQVTYTANGGLGTNTFTYTVSDALGASVTKTVTVIVYNPEGFNRLTAPVVLAGGAVSFSYSGIPGYSYAVDWATNLAEPIIWMPLATNVADASGLLSFTNLTAEPVSFFRTRQVP